MQQVLLRLRKYKLYAKLSKCEFGISKLEFLSFYVKVDKIKPDLKRIYSIIKWLKPKSFHDMQVFLGFANFYCCFVHKYSHIAHGLIDLLVSMENGRKTTPFKWTLDAEQSFQELKAAFTQALILIYFDPFKKIRVKTNAFKFAIASYIF